MASLSSLKSVVDGGAEEGAGGEGGADEEEGVEAIKLPKPL